MMRSCCKYLKNDSSSLALGGLSKLRTLMLEVSLLAVGKRTEKILKIFCFTTLMAKSTNVAFLL